MKNNQAELWEIKNIIVKSEKNGGGDRLERKLCTPEEKNGKLDDKKDEITQD